MVVSEKWYSLSPTLNSFPGLIYLTVASLVNHLIPLGKFGFFLVDHHMLLQCRTESNLDMVKGREMVR